MIVVGNGSGGDGSALLFYQLLPSFLRRLFLLDGNVVVVDNIDFVVVAIINGNFKTETD